MDTEYWGDSEGQAASLEKNNRSEPFFGPAIVFKFQILMSIQFQLSNYKHIASSLGEEKKTGNTIGAWRGLMLTFEMGGTVSILSNI